MSSSTRPLDDTLAELVAGLGAFGARGAEAFERTGIAPLSVHFDLPVEAGVEFLDGRWVVLADSPRTRLRTDFDRPPGRLKATIAVERIG